MLQADPEGSRLLQSIGFDMDYTLSQYRPETFEVLAYNLTIEKLVNNFKYPKVYRVIYFDILPISLFLQHL